MHLKYGHNKKVIFFRRKKIVAKIQLICLLRHFGSITILVISYQLTESLWS